MKHKGFVLRSLSVPLCLLAMILFAGSAWALGINFSVLTGASGQPGTGVAAAGGDGAHIYLGGGNNNVIRIPLSALGLQPGDEVDALTMDVGAHPTIDAVLGSAATIFFSVDDSAVGIVTANTPNDVFGEATIKPNDAAGDTFQAWGVMGAPGNSLVIDDPKIGLLGPPIPEDDEDALDLWAVGITYPIPAGFIGFSLAAGSPSLGQPPWFATEDDVLATDGAGGFGVLVNAAFLGIVPGDDLDALFVGSSLNPLFSVKGTQAGGIPFLGGYGPGDILGVDGMATLMGLPWGSPMGDGIADVIVPASWLGLYDYTSPPGTPPFDNLNALDVSLDLPALVDPETVDTDGDELPDYWEEREKLDPEDDGSVDPDMGGDGDPDEDGYTNKDEYDNGTDPWEFDAGGLPVMQPWPVTVVLALVIVAFAAVTLTFRKRLA